MKELKKAYQHALESDNMKTAFIRNVSHEVRTPLNIISGFALIIAAGDITMCAEELKDISQMVMKNTNIITNQFDELIEISLNENSGEEIKTEAVDIQQLLLEITGDYQPLLNHGVEIKIENNLPDSFIISTNRKMLYRMVSLLIDNAIKNTTEGHILAKTSSTDKKISIVIEDTGCGIDPKEAESIFERFVKLDNFKEGLGLGLPLCRMIAHRMKGEVLLDTTYVGPGARFVINLPLN
jgi:signal transduction histidine kinase